jgi:uncharacterized damage-inducible protein DinB
MLSDSLTILFRHNLWANLRLLENCSGLTAEQLDATIPGAYGSIQDILQHITLAEQGYYSRISTGKMFHHSEKTPTMTLADMMASLRTTGEGLIEWAGRVQADDTVELDWDGTLREVPKTIILTQVINHATEHREQVKTILTQLGIEPPDLQSWKYFDELEE